jgi:hypothetical protein
LRVVTALDIGQQRSFCLRWPASNAAIGS